MNNAQQVTLTPASSSLDTASSTFNTASSAYNSDIAFSASNAASSTPSGSAWALAYLIMLDCAKTPDELWALRPYMLVALEQVAAMESLPDKAYEASVHVALLPPLDTQNIRAIVAALPAVFDEVLALEEFKDVNFKGLLHSYEVCAEPEASDQTPQKTFVSPDSDHDMDLTNSGDDNDHGPESSARSLRD